MPPYIKTRRVLPFIPSRYGHVSSITHATDCLIAGFSYIVQSGGKLSPTLDLATLRAYARALRSLQEAIDEEELRMTPETLCAAELLGLFELLNGGPNVDTWLRLAGGAARLIELRGPDRFQSDFELSLFMTHAGPIITEAIMTGKRCFLGEERWQQVIQAAICNDPLVTQDEAHLVIKLWERLGKGPNLFKEATDLILHPTLAPTNDREDLIWRLIEGLKHLQKWLTLAEQYQYGQEYNRQPSSKHRATDLLRNFTFRKASSEHRITWRVLQGTYLPCCLLKTRSLFAMAPSRFPELEAACQALAKDAMSMAAHSVSDANDTLVRGLFTSEIAWIAKSIIETGDIWCKSPAEICSHPNQNDTGTIQKWRFRAWCTAMRKNV